MLASETTLTAPAPPRNSAEVMRNVERVLTQVDLSALTTEERLAYVRSVCESLGLNWLTKPFEYIQTDQGLKLYLTKDGAAQLRSKHHISLRIISRELQGQVYVVTAQASMPDGRTDESIGAVPMVKEGGEWKTSQNNKKYFAGNGQFKPLNPEATANQIMRCETKAKRRATLSLCGLGLLDQSETEEDAPRWDYDVTATTQPQQQQQEPHPQPTPQPPPPQPPPQPEPEEPADPELAAELNKFAAMQREARLNKFASMKSSLAAMLGDVEGVEAYHSILRDAGAADGHAWQLSTMAQAKKAFSQMWKLLREGSDVLPAEEEG